MTSIQQSAKTAVTLGLTALALPSLTSCGTTKTVADVVPATVGTQTGKTLVDYGTTVRTSTRLTFERSLDNCSQCPTDLQRRGRYVEKEMLVDTERSSTQNRVEGLMNATGNLAQGVGVAAFGFRFKPSNVTATGGNATGGNATATGGAGGAAAASSTSSSSSSAAATAVGTGG